jgi:hypothetical protein
VSTKDKASHIDIPKPWQISELNVCYTTPNSTKSNKNEININLQNNGNSAQVKKFDFDVTDSIKIDDLACIIKDAEHRLLADNGSSYDTNNTPGINNNQE